MKYSCINDVVKFDNEISLNNDASIDNDMIEWNYEVSIKNDATIDALESNNKASSMMIWSNLIIKHRGSPTLRKHRGSPTLRHTRRTLIPDSGETEKVLTVSETENV